MVSLLSTVQGGETARILGRWWDVRRKAGRLVPPARGHHETEVDWDGLGAFLRASIPSHPGSLPP